MIDVISSSSIPSAVASCICCDTVELKMRASRKKKFNINVTLLNSNHSYQNMNKLQSEQDIIRKISWNSWYSLADAGGFTRDAFLTSAVVVELALSLELTFSYFGWDSRTGGATFSSGFDTMGVDESLLNSDLTNGSGGSKSFIWIIYRSSAGFNCPITSKYETGISTTSFSVSLKCECGAIDFPTN